MIANNKKTSVLIPSQLPEFIRDNPDYENFVLFLQAYYEWLEQSGNVTDKSKNILNYIDIDNTTDEFTQYFYDEFLSYFPVDIVADKNKVVKIAKELYQAKGTPASFKFLFRVLYNENVEFFFTRDAILRASAGKWYITNSLTIISSDLNFLKTQNLFVFGETSKSVAVIQNTQSLNNKIQIFIADTQRQFLSGEYIRIVDSNFKDVYFLNGQIVSSSTPGAESLRAEIVGQINSVTINNQGNKYKIGDPLVFFGGHNVLSTSGAAASVSSVSSGSIQSLSVVTGGYGYRTSPNTVIGISTTGASVIPTANVASLNSVGIANVTFLPTDTIQSKLLISLNTASYLFSNMSTANANTRLTDALSFSSFATYPISSLNLLSGGVGIESVDAITATSLYNTSNTAQMADLKSVGILAPIQILNGGSGYKNNDTILINGGTGFGAFANVTSVNPANSNTIVSVSYVKSTNTQIIFPLGGMGYTSTSLPTASVFSANVSANGAVLSIPGILGDGASFTSGVSGIGQINDVNITNYGQDYTSVPSISLAVQDIIITNVLAINLPISGDVIFQSNNSTFSTASYFSTVDSVVAVTINSNPLNSIYRLRIYNYNVSSINPLNLLINKRTNITYNILSSYNLGRYVNGIITYGDGSATASATFADGIIKSQGQYLDTSGQPSGSDVLQSDVYNNYTYELIVQKEIAKYRKTLLGLIHPSGMKVLGRYTLSSANNRNLNIQEALYTGHNFATIYPNSQANMVTNAVNGSNNIITFTSLGSANIATGLIANTTTIRLTSASGDMISGLITNVNSAANQITLQSNTWLTFTNVASVTATSGTNKINISYLTGLYKLYNGSVYSNTAYPLMDIVKINDTVLIPNNTSRIVTNVDYANNIITVGVNLTSSVLGSNSYLSVIRPFVASAVNIQYFGPQGIPYIPELITENGITITTEDGNIILLG